MRARIIADNIETVDGDGDCRKSHDSVHAASKRKIRAGSPIRVTFSGEIMRSLIFIARESANNDGRSWNRDIAKIRIMYRRGSLTCFKEK